VRKTKTTVHKTMDFLVSDWSYPKTDGLGPHHCFKAWVQYVM